MVVDAPVIVACVVAASTPFWAGIASRFSWNQKLVAQLAVAYDCLGVVLIPSLVTPDWSPLSTLLPALVSAVALVICIRVLRRIANERGDRSLFDRPL